MKIIKWSVLVILLVLIVGGAIVYFNLNGIIRSTVEKESTRSLDLQTSLGSANLSILGKSLSLDDFQIASPEGFAAPHMFTLDEIAVDVKYGELRDDPVRIQSITIDEPHLVIERNSANKFNFQVLMDKKPQAPPSDQPADQPPMKLVIGTLGVKDAKVTLRHGLNIPGVQPEYVVTLPPLMLENIGTGEGAQNGVAIKEVVMTVITKMSNEAIDKGQLPEEVKLLLAGDLKGLTDQMVQQGMTRAVSEVQKKIGGEAGAVIGNVLQDATKPGADPGKAIERGVGDFLKSTTQPSR